MLRITTNQLYVFLLTLVATIACYMLPENFKLFTLITMFFLMVYTIITNNFLLSLISLSFITQHFLSPGKYYSFTLIEAGLLRAEPYYTQGLIDGYGIVASDILLMIMCIYYIRRFILGVYTKKKSNSLINRLIISCWVAYIVYSLYSSLYFSYYPFFSIVNLLQYSKIIFFYIIFSELFESERTTRIYKFPYVLSGFSIANSLIGFYHFIVDAQKTILSDRYVGMYTSVEHELRIAAPKGLYLHSNEFALFSLVWMVLLVYYSTYQNNIYVKLAIAFNLLSIILSQSRTVWALTILFIALLGYQAHTKILTFIHHHKRSSIYIGLIALLCVWAVTPRILSLQYTFDGGSGSIRTRMVEEAIEAISTNPWIGYGINTGVHTLFDKNPDGYLQDFPFDVHNGYLQMAIESGVVGVVLFFFPLVYLVRYYSEKMYTAVHKNYVLGAFTLSLLLMYYIVQPHGGRLEIPMIGIAVSFSAHILNHDN